MLSLKAAAPSVRPVSAPAITAQPPRRAAAPSKLTTVLVLAWDVGHNPLGRAYMLAEALARKYTVVLAGFQFPRYGNAVWKPLRHAPFATVAIPGSAFPDFQRTADRLARRIDADVVIACKARLPSLQTGLMWKATSKRPLFFDVDDYELGFFPSRDPLSDLSTVEPEALVEPFEETWTRYTENLLPWSDGVIVSNEALQRRFGGTIVPHARDETVFDPTRVDRAASRRAFGFENDARVVLFVGTPRPHKGVLEVLAAIKSAGRPDSRFVVVGTPPDKPFENELRRLGGDTLLLLPDQPFDRLPEITAAADLVCLIQDAETEIAKYQLPAKVVDAIAMGVPVLSTDVPPLRDLIRKGAVEPVARDELPARISAWLDTAADARRAHTERARAAFRSSYSYEAILGTLSGLIEQSLATPKPLSEEAGRFLAGQAARFAVPPPPPPPPQTERQGTRRRFRHVLEAGRRGSVRASFRHAGRGACRAPRHTANRRFRRAVLRPPSASRPPVRCDDAPSGRRRDQAGPSLGSRRLRQGKPPRLPVRQPKRARPLSAAVRVLRLR